MERGVSAVHVRRGDIYKAVVIDVDLNARIRDDLVDGLSSRPDDRTDLVRINLQGNNPRRVRRQFFSRFRQLIQHFFHNVHSALICLSQRVLQHFLGKAVNLDVHLNGSNAFGGSRHLKVHVSQEVFHSLNIGKDCHLAASVFLYPFNQSHGDTCYRRGNRNARVHQSQAASAYGGLGSGTV